MGDEGQRAETDIIVRCPNCGTWAMRGRYEGRAEVNCSGARCKATLEVEIKGGRPTITVLDRPKKA